MTYSSPFCLNLDVGTPAIGLLYFIKRIVTANELNNPEITIIINNTTKWHTSPKICSEKSEEINSKIQKQIDPSGGAEGAGAS